MAGFRARGFKYLDPLHELERSEYYTRDRRRQARNERLVDDWIDRMNRRPAERPDYWENSSRRQIPGEVDPSLRTGGKWRPRPKNIKVHVPSWSARTVYGMGPEQGMPSPATSPRSSGGGFFRANHWRPYDVPSRRLNPVAASGSRPATGGGGMGTFLSRYGDAKGGLGNGGIFGASASRYRSAREFLNNPNNFMRRAALVYFIDEIGKGITNYRGWNKVSYLDTVEDIEKKLPKKDAVESVIMGTAAGVASFVTGVASPFRRAGNLLLAPFFGEAQAARMESLGNAIQEYARNGFQGPSPRYMVNQLGMDVNKELVVQAKEVKRRAIQDLVEATDRTVDRMQDALARRGVGSIDKIKTAYKLSPDAAKALKTFTARRSLQAASVEEVTKEVLNRQRQDK